MNERFTALMTGREKLLTAAALLRKTAETHGEAPESNPKPQLDMERVRETFEDLAEQNLAKKADIETAIARVQEDPTVICDVIRNIGLTALTARKAAAESSVAEAPGTLVGKTASASKRSPGNNMSSMFVEVGRKIEEKVARAGA